MTFLIKTPVGSLVLIGASLVYFSLRGELQGRTATFLLVPPALWLASSLSSRIDLGLRHILPVYPFLFVVASRLAVLRLRRPWVPLLVGVPLLTTATSTLRVIPHQLAYFNELVGGPAEGYRYLSDSNLDWGQDLKGLRAYMDQQGVSMIYLSYFGNASPSYYGIPYQYLPADGPLGPAPQEGPPRNAKCEVLAISVVNLQGVYFREKDLYHWLYDRTPVAKIGYSIFVYDLTGDADAHWQLAQLYLKEDLPSFGATELHRILAINPAHAKAKQLLQQLSRQ